MKYLKTEECESSFDVGNSSSVFLWACFRHEWVPKALWNLNRELSKEDQKQRSDHMTIRQNNNTYLQTHRRTEIWRYISSLLCDVNFLENKKRCFPSMQLIVCLAVKKPYLFSSCETWGPPCNRECNMELEPPQVVVIFAPIHPNSTLNLCFGNEKNANKWGRCNLKVTLCNF